MKLEQCALQLYTVRERMKTRADLEQTLARVREIGYPAVQVSGLDWSLITEAELVALCREIGLTICATHEDCLSRWCVNGTCQNQISVVQNRHMVTEFLDLVQVV